VARIRILAVVSPGGTAAENPADGGRLRISWMTCQRRRAGQSSSAKLFFQKDVT